MSQEHTAQSGLEETTMAGFPALIGRPAHPRPDNAPVIFLHGAFANHHCFHGWVQRFADEGYRTVAASRRGRLGVGPEHAAGLTFDGYVEDTLAVIDELSVPGGTGVPPAENPIIVGHSL